MGLHKHLSLALLLGVIALVAGTTSHFYRKGKRPEPRDPQVMIDSKSDYRLESVSAGKCVQLASAPAGENREAQIGTCSESADQRFHFDLLPDGFYRIRLAGANQCLDVVDGSQNDGASVKGVTWAGTPHQQWQVLAAGDSVRLMARHSDKALDLWQEKTEDGAPLKQMFWKGSRNQQFRLQAVDRAHR